jgi:hypothetical protein
MGAQLSNLGLKLILLLFLVLAFGYSILVPMWEAPDETAHYLYVLILAREERLPFDSETYEALQPPGYYWPAAQLFRLLEQIDPELIRPGRPPLSEIGRPTRYDWTAENYRPLWGARILRWLNIITGVLTLTFIYKGSKRVFPNSNLPLAATALAGLTPQFLHNTAAITNDAPANLVGAIFFWLITIVAQERQTWWQTALIVMAAVFLPFIIKLTILPMSLTLLLAVLWQRRHILGRYWHWLAAGGLLFALLLLGILSLIVLDTDTLIWRTIWLRATYIRPDFFNRHSLWFIFETFSTGYWGRLSYRQVGLSPTLGLWLTGLALMGLVSALALLLKNFSDLRYKLFWYGLPITAVILLTLLWIAGQTGQWWAFPPKTLIMALALLFLALIRQRHLTNNTSDNTNINVMSTTSTEKRFPFASFVPSRETSFRPLWIFIWLAALLTLLIIVKNTLSTPQFQGRFFFPALGPLSILITAGWHTLLPRRLAPYLSHLILVLLVLLNLFVWYDQVIPIYYQPFLD